MNKNTDAKIAANNRYRDRKYDTFSISVDKGLKDVYTNHAKKMNESLSAFVKRAITEQIERDVKQGN